MAEQDEICLEAMNQLWRERGPDFFITDVELYRYLREHGCTQFQDEEPVESTSD
jgi:hypothetical protein